MVPTYAIFGRQIGSHHLAMGVLGTLFAGSAYALGGSEVKKSTQGPPINAQSPDEESFIKDFLKQADGEAKDASASKEKAPAH